MKMFIAVLSIASASAFAAEVKCISSQTGKSYELSPKYGEIYVYDSKGNEEESLDGLYTKTKFVETLPSKTVTTFFDAEDDSVVAELVTMNKKTTGSYRDDKKLVCTQSK